MFNMDKKNKNFRNVMFKKRTWEKLISNRKLFGYSSVDEYVNALLEATWGFSRFQIEYMRSVKVPNTAINDGEMYKAIGVDQKNWHRVGEQSNEDSVGEN